MNKQVYGYHTEFCQFHKHQLKRFSCPMTIFSFKTFILGTFICCLPAFHTRSFVITSVSKGLVANMVFSYYCLLMRQICCLIPVLVYAWINPLSVCCCLIHVLLQIVHHHWNNTTFLGHRMEGERSGGWVWVCYSHQELFITITVITIIAGKCYEKKQGKQIDR